MVDLGKPKPCPFCGHETSFDWGDGSTFGVWRWRYCEECHAHGPHVLMKREGENVDTAQKRADVAWNDRVSAYSPEKEEAWKAALEKIAGLLTLEETGQSADLRMTVAALDSAIGIARNALAAKADGGAS